MTTRTLIAAAALTFAAAGSAFAQEATAGSSAFVVESSTSRSVVMAEAQRAVAQGRLHESAQIEQAFGIDGMLSRQAVREATIQALKRGSVASLNAEAHSFG